jgi:hypothetical protein
VPFSADAHRAAGQNGVSAARAACEVMGEPPPFWFVRMFVESREKTSKNRTARLNHGATL